jgi:hypothetical protein
MSDSVRELVDRLGHWSDPALLEAILARGEDAIDPLLEVVRRDIDDGDEEIEPLYLAIGMLGQLGARSAIPSLLELYRRYDDDVLEELSEALGRLGGADVVEPALEIGRDRSLRWYPRAMALQAAEQASRDDPALRTRVAEALRGLLADLVARAPDLDEDDKEMASSLVTDLAELADPLARDLIQSAFAADIVEQFLIAPEDVEGLYSEGGRAVIAPVPWLDNYRRSYQKHQEASARMREREQRTPDFRPERPIPARPEPIPTAIEPIRNSGAKLGRNDRCWCGSGKKYKQCHLRRDQGSP